MSGRPLLTPWRMDQERIALHPARLKVLANGRRWGKTTMSATLAVGVAYAGGAVAWVAPIYKSTRPLWRMVERSTVLMGSAADISQTERVCKFPGRGWLGLYTAEHDVGLRGEAFDLVIVDEAAQIKEETYTDVLVPTLADRDGRILLISTPKGLNWFYHEWVKAQDMQDNRAAAFTAPTSANPIPSIRRAAELARQMLPERTYRQEWLAEFVADEGAVFRNVRTVCVGKPERPIAGHQYVIGCDWGKVEDFSVFSVIDVTSKRQVYQDRSNHLEYITQVGRLKALCQLYKPALVIAEANSIGTAIVEQLARADIRVYAWTATNATKQAIVEGLSLAMEQSQVVLLDDPALIGELSAFEATRTPSGLLRYAAPEGMHDDCVIALGLAWAVASKPRQQARVYDFAMRAG